MVRLLKEPRQNGGIPTQVKQFTHGWYAQGTTAHNDPFFWICFYFHLDFCITCVKQNVVMIMTAYIDTFMYRWCSYMLFPWSTLFYQFEIAVSQLSQMVLSKTHNFKTLLWFLILWRIISAGGQQPWYQQCRTCTAGVQFCTHNLSCHFRVFHGLTIQVVSALIVISLLQNGIGKKYYTLTNTVSVFNIIYV